MEAQEDKNKQSDTKEQIKTLEQEMKISFKEGSFDAMKAIADKLKALDPENRLTEKLMKKVEIAKKKETEKEKMLKAKEYIVMLKQLYKNKDVEKLNELAKEFKEFDSESRHADKWILRAEKLSEKLGSKKVEGVKEEKMPMKIGAPAQSENKMGIVQMMAKRAEEKKEEPIKPSFSLPLVKPQTINPAPKIDAEAPKISVASTTPVSSTTPVTPAEPKGNIFTSMFGKKDEMTSKKSIIDTIVAKTGKKREAKAVEKEVELSEEPKKKDNSMKILTFSKVFMNFAMIFIALSAAFLYVEWIDKDNTVLGFAGITENTGKKLHSASQTVTTLKKEEVELNKEIELYKGGYDDKASDVVDKIIAERINWPDIFAKIKEVTNSVYELNDFFEYIEYNNYAFDAENRTIRVSGTLSDPLGRNLTKLVELEEAFMYYPKDRSNPEDKTEPYFTGFKEFTSFSKSLDEETGRYTSSFQLSFALNK